MQNYKYMKKVLVQNKKFRSDPLIKFPTRNLSNFHGFLFIMLNLKVTQTYTLRELWIIILIVTLFAV